MESDRRASRGDVERYDLEILLRRPSLRTNIPRRVSQVCREDFGTEETKCGAGCVRGQWLQSFANRNSFTLVYGILGSFYGSYYAYFYGVLSTLERRFKVSSQTTGLIAATGDFARLITCLILSQCVPKANRPKWIGIGVFLIVISTVVFTLPHFLYEPYEAKNTILRYPTYYSNETVRRCIEESETCRNELEERNGPIILLILAQSLHGMGGSLYFIAGKSYQDDNIEKDKPAALLSLLSVLEILGPAFGYWLSSISLKISQHPKLTPNSSENEPHWIGAWWLGSLVIGFVLIVPGFLVIFFPTTLPKTALKRIQNQLQGIPEATRNVERKEKISAMKKLFINPTITCTHFSAIFNILGFMAYFVFLPKYVETQYRVSASQANLIAGSVTLISSSVGIVAANSVITRYRPSARALASWTVIVGILSIGGLAFYIFIDCEENDFVTTAMITQCRTRNELQPSEIYYEKYTYTHLTEILVQVQNNSNFRQLDNICKCANSSFFPLCDEHNQPFISFCHAGCENILHINNTQGYEICDQTSFPSNARKVFSGFCNVDCHSKFVTFIIVTCSLSFIYATGRASIYWFEAKSEQKQEKCLTTNLGMILGFVVSIPVPVVFGYLMDDVCLLWEGNCKQSGNCWLYDNAKLRLNMNLTAIGFSIIGVLFDVGVWYSVKNIELFDDTEEYNDESDEK